MSFVGFFDFWAFLVTSSTSGDSLSFAKLELNDDFNGGLPVTVTNTAPAAGSGIIKQSVTSYNTSTNYISRRMIALPTQVDVSGKNDLGGVELVSRQMFYYDENGYTGTGQNISPTQH